MKQKMSISIVLALTLFLAVVGISVWAGPGRQGTVPTPPDEAILIAGETVTLGTVEITASVNGTVTRVKDPETDIGPAPSGLSFLSDAIIVELDEEGDVTVCYPYPKEVKDQDGGIYKWDEDAEEWVAVKGIVSGDPAKICFTDKGITGGSYALIGG